MVGPNADGALGEVSIEAAASANSPDAPPGVECPADPPTIKLAPKSPVTREEEDNDTEPDLEALIAQVSADPNYSRRVRNMSWQHLK